jgi:rod shape determining protein RodA
MRRSLAHTLRQLRGRFDWVLTGTIVAIVTLGLINLYSATKTSQPQLYGQQLRWLCVGVGVFFAAAAVDYRVWQRFAYVAYAGGLLLLVAVLVVGPVVKGSQRWLALGSLRLQPSELMKVMLILALAKHIQDEPFPEDNHLRKLAIPAGLIAVPFLLVAKQPDLGTAGLISLIGFTLVALIRFRAKTLVWLGGTAALVVPVAWLYLLADYQKQRVRTFINPEADPSGAGWHSLQSIFAIGSGRLWGKGYLKGTQNQLQFLPEHWTDFPFAVWAEEWGFVGSMVLLALYVFLILWLLHLASQVRDRFATVVCLGATALVFWHAAINIGMVTGLLPVVGVTLPLVSYGGSSLLTVMAALGLVMNVSVRRFRF